MKRFGGCSQRSGSRSVIAAIIFWRRINFWKGVSRKDATVASLLLTVHRIPLHVAQGLPFDKKVRRSPPGFATGGGK
jgi:hypothetical protein